VALCAAMGDTLSYFMASEEVTVELLKVKMSACAAVRFRGMPD